MEIHRRIFDAIPRGWSKLFEDIGRGIEYGTDRPTEAALGIAFVDTILNLRRQIEGIRLEYDLQLEIDLEDDLKNLDVALEELRFYLQNPTGDDRARRKAFIFRGAAFEIVDDIYRWAKEHSESP